MSNFKKDQVVEFKSPPRMVVISPESFTDGDVFLKIFTGNCVDHVWVSSSALQPLKRQRKK